jgi:hypothetical protein
MKAAPSTNGHARRSTVSSVDNGADRGADGKFIAGNHASAGNPFARAVAERRRAVMEACSPADVQAVMRRLHQLALGGDVPAARTYLEYTLGKPAPLANPDDLDSDEVRVLMDGPRMDLLAAALLGNASAADALKILREELGMEGRAQLLWVGLSELLNRKGNQNGPRTFDVPSDR